MRNSKLRYRDILRVLRVIIKRDLSGHQLHYNQFAITKLFLELLTKQLVLIFLCIIKYQDVLILYKIARKPISNNSFIII